MFFNKKSVLERINYQMIIENTFCDYLNTKAKDGWEFYGVLGEYLMFKGVEPRSIKYQIEYGTTDYDYDDYLNDVGYKVVCNYKRMTIYKNEDINAPDLHTDDLVRLEATRDMISKRPLIIFMAIMLLMLPTIIALNLLFTFPKTLGMLFKSIELVPIFLVLFAIIMSICCFTLQSLEVKRVINKIINNKDYNYKKLDFISRVLSISEIPILSIYLVSFIFLLAMMFTSFKMFFAFVLLTAALCAVVYILDKVMRKHRIDKKVITVVIVAVYFVAVFIRDPILDKYRPKKVETTQTIETYMNEQKDVDVNNGILCDTQESIYNPNDMWVPEKYERFTTCVNDFVAKEIMKDDIIQFENETRASNEYIEQQINETGQFSSSDVKYLSYKDAFKTLTEFKHHLVDECYYNEHFFIARKDNKILVSYMQDEDNYIDNVIEHYFK